MTIPVYKSEIDAGIGEAVANNFLNFDCDLKQSEEFILPKKILAGKEDWDLFYLSSILVSCGWNLNDDVFDPAETWAAKDTPINKQVNYMHNEADIIGHMIASLVLDENGNVVEGNEMPEKFDIAVQAVLYKTWSDDKLQKRMDEMIESIAEGKLFVSMECLFRNFDYAVVTAEGKKAIIPRNESSAHLTKHLRVYGGTGEFEGNKIGRLLRSFTFSGKGIVENPANPRSIIFNSTDPFSAAANLNDEIVISNEENSNMSDVADVQAKLDAANEEIARLKTEGSEAKVAELEAQVEAVQAEKTELESTIANKDQEIEDLKATVAAKDEEKKEDKKKMDEQKAAIEALEAEKVVSARTAQLVEAGVDSEKATELVEKWASASDEQFADVVELSAAKYGKNDEEDDEANASDSDDADVDDADAAADNADLDNADVDPEPALASNDDTNSADELQKTAASWMGGILKYGKQDSDNE